jgi:hypothetical protein
LYHAIWVNKSQILHYTCYNEKKKEKRNLWFFVIDCSLLACRY